MDKDITITKDWTLDEVIAENPDFETILTGFGLHCFSCPLSATETLEEAAMVHGIDLEFMLEKLNNPDIQ